MKKKITLIAHKAYRLRGKDGAMSITVPMAAKLFTKVSEGSDLFWHVTREGDLLLSLERKGEEVPVA